MTLLAQAYRHWYLKVTQSYRRTSTARTGLRCYNLATPFSSKGFLISIKVVAILQLDLQLKVEQNVGACNGYNNIMIVLARPASQSHHDWWGQSPFSIIYMAKAMASANERKLSRSQVHFKTKGRDAKLEVCSDGAVPQSWLAVHFLWASQIPSSGKETRSSNQRVSSKPIFQHNASVNQISSSFRRCGELSCVEQAFSSAGLQLFLFATNLKHLPKCSSLVACRSLCSWSIYASQDVSSVRRGDKAACNISTTEQKGMILFAFLPLGVLWVWN